MLPTVSAILASGIVTKVCAGLFATSSLLTAAKNNGAKHKIEREGYRVNPDERSITERAMSFVKDYFFLVVPGYNIIKSFKKFLRPDKEYAEERKELYASREMLEVVDPTKAEVKSEGKNPVKTETKNEGKNPVKAEVKTEKPVQTKKPEATTSTISLDGYSVEYLRSVQKTLKSKSANLEKVFNKKKEAGASVEELVEIINIQKQNIMLMNQIEAKIQELSYTESTGTSRILK